jgi:hypothetical protein
MCHTQWQMLDKVTVTLLALFETFQVTQPLDAGSDNHGKASTV